VEHASIIERKVRELSDLLQRLLEFARVSEDRGVIDLNDLVLRELDVRNSPSSQPQVDGKAAAETVTVVASRALLHVAIAGVCDEAFADCPTGEAIRSRVERIDGCARWILDLPGGPSEIWSDDNRETWMNALDRRGRDRDRLLRQGIVLSVLRRLGATYRVAREDTGRWSLTILFVDEAP
jgi:hypothetical protein